MGTFTVQSHDWIFLNSGKYYWYYYCFSRTLNPINPLQEYHKEGSRGQALKHPPALYFRSQIRPQPGATASNEYLAVQSSTKFCIAPDIWEADARNKIELIRLQHCSPDWSLEHNNSNNCGLQCWQLLVCIAVKLIGLLHTLAQKSPIWDWHTLT